MNYNHFPRKALYIDIDTGEILSYSEMIDRFDEYTPMSELWEFFDIYEQ